MSPALRNLSPRVTSAAISVGDRRWSAGDCVGGGEVGRDVACGVVCSGSGAGEARGGVGSGARAGWARSGGAAGEVSRRVAGAFAGAELAPGSADRGIGTGRGVAAIGGRLETIGARSVGVAAFAG